MPDSNGEKRRTVEIVSLIVSLFTIYIILLSHSSAATYRAGYLSYFNVSIDAVPYWPKISDFMSAPIVALIYTLLITVIGVVLMFLGNLAYKGVHDFATRKDRKFLQSATEGTVFTKPILISCTLLVAAIVSFTISYSTMYQLGANSAAQTHSFTQLINNKTTKILIYQHDGTGLVKDYNYDTNEFSKDYEVLDLTGQKFEQIEISRD